MVNSCIMASFFTKDNKKSLFSALLKLRYKDCEVDWTNANMVGRIVAKEMYRGIDYLMEDENLNAFLFAESNRRSGGGYTIPALFCAAKLLIIRELYKCFGCLLHENKNYGEKRKWAIL